MQKGTGKTFICMSQLDKYSVNDKCFSLDLFDNIHCSQDELSTFRTQKTAIHTPWKSFMQNLSLQMTQVAYRYHQ